MKCPVCDAPSLVKETRGSHRRRECFNGHRFSTQEILTHATPLLLQRQAKQAKQASGLELDHLCVNPPCINIDHLELVTPQENSARRGRRD